MSRRPGIIVAIGTVCIIVACLSALACFFTAGLTFELWFVSKIAAAATSTATISSTTSSSSVTYFSAGPTGTSSTHDPTLAPEDAAVAVNAIRLSVPLAPAQTRELQNLLRGHGRDVLGLGEDDPVTAAGVRSVMSHAGRRVGPPTEAYFDTPLGHVDVWPNAARFTAADRTLTIDASAAQHSESIAGNAAAFAAAAATRPGISAAAPVHPRQLTPAQIGQAVAIVQASAPSPLTPPQLKALNDALADPEQDLVYPALPPNSGLVQPEPNGNVSITFMPGATLALGPQGQVLFHGVRPSNIQVNGAAAAVVLGECAASGALAIYLLVIGIMVLRPTFRSPRLLKIYALLKIPLAIVGGTALMWMGLGFATGLSPAAPPRVVGFIFWGIALTVFGCALPIALLIALRTRGVREYFQIGDPSIAQP